MKKKVVRRRGVVYLTAAQVQEIRKARAGLKFRERITRSDPRSIASLAKRFKISSGHVSHIVSRKVWKDLPRAKS